MLQGKLISFSPKMNGAVQDTYSGTNGLLYKFVLVMEINGTEEKGDANAKSTSPSWKTGDIYSFERKVNGQQGQFISYSKLENVSNPKQVYSGKNSSGGIEFAKQKAAECAYHATACFWADPDNKQHFKQEIYHGPTTVFYQHIVETGIEKDIWLNIAALNALVDRSEKVYRIMAVKGKKHIDLWLEAADKIKQIMILLINPNDSNAKPN